MDGLDHFNELKNLEDSERKIFLDELYRNSVKSAGNPAAEWRLRVKRQHAIDDRLSSLGDLALLGGNSLLVLHNGDSVQTLTRHSNWRRTLEESPLYAQLNDVQRGQLKGAKGENYARLEQGIQSLCQMLCLAVKDLNDPLLTRSFSEFKLACVKHAFPSDRRLDEVLNHIKRLGKLCQSILLKVRIEPLEGFLPTTEIKGRTYILPFVGPLGFISNIYHNGKRTGNLTYLQAFQLAQIGNTPRSLPYPSKDQIIKSVQETIEVVKTKIDVDDQALKAYRRGIAAVKTSVPKLKHNRTHCSMVGSGAYERSRREGGRSRYLVLRTRIYSDRTYDESFSKLIGMYDQFGQVLLHKATVEYLKGIPDLEIPIGNILYVELDDIVSVIENYQMGRKVPRHLGHLLNLTASMEIRLIGEYNIQPEFHNGIMFFKQKNGIHFNVNQLPAVKADVSVESGLKTRMITAGLAAFAHLSQLPANYMREYLSQDPFHRVGFEESDKLWEVLKTYRKHNASQPAAGP